MTLDEHNQIVAAARDAHAAAMGARREVERRRDDVKEALMKEVYAKLEAEFGADLRAAVAAENEAQEHHKDCVIARAVEHPDTPHPVGTVLYEWGRPRFSQDWEKTGKRGVVEVCTRESKFPSNIAWSKPSPGEAYIRMLKTDGTPSLQVISVNRAGHRWLPEGRRPK